MMFTLVLLLLVAVVVVAVGGVYITVTNQFTRRKTGLMETRPAEMSPGISYESMGLETTEDMKLRLYSIEEYRDEHGGTRAGSNRGFVAAPKSYRQLEHGWVESPRTRRRTCRSSRRRTTKATRST